MGVDECSVVLFGGRKRNYFFGCNFSYRYLFFGGRVG